MIQILIDIYNIPYKLFIFSFVISFILLSIESRINKRNISFKNCLKISLLASTVSIIILYINNFIIKYKNNIQTNYNNVILSNTNFN
jgi:hypothetical protein